MAADIYLEQTMFACHLLAYEPKLCFCWRLYHCDRLSTIFCECM